MRPTPRLLHLGGRVRASPRPVVVVALGLGWLVGSLVAAPAACSLFVSTAGLDDGPADSAHESSARKPNDSATPADSRSPDSLAPVDAARDTLRDAGSDAVSDAGTRDSRAPADTGRDATQMRDATADTSADWCEAQDASYRLCSDFDKAPVTLGFDLGLIPNGVGGSFTEDTPLSVSRPNSGLGVAKGYGAGGTGGALLEGALWAFGSRPSTLHCAVQWNAQSVSTVALDYAHIVAIEVNASDGAQEVNLSIQMHADGSIGFLEDYPGGVGEMNHVIPITVVLGTWYPVTMTLTTAGGSTSYTVNVGGQSASGTLGTPLSAMSAGIFEVGPAYFGGATTDPSPGWTFAYDNVVCF
jgi:hypothetical protein